MSFRLKVGEPAQRLKGAKGFSWSLHGTKHQGLDSVIYCKHMSNTLRGNSSCICDVFIVATAATSSRPAGRCTVHEAFISCTVTARRASAGQTSRELVM